MKPCLHTIEGCFKGVSTDKQTQMGEFHALITLDSNEVRRVIIPQAIALPQDIANSYLLATTPFLIAENRYVCDLKAPRIWLKGGGKQTMSVIRGHHVIRMTPIDAHTTTPHRINLLHLREPYDPPSYFNNSTHTQNSNRPNINTPTAFIYHLRYGCASEVVLRRTQEHVIGMQVRKDSWKLLSTQLPCNACLAGKMRKTKKATSSAFTNVKNLALSWTPATQDKQTTPNQHVSTDWGIINKTSQVGTNNVFALYLDLQTGWTAVYPCASRGQASDTLAQYCQEHGTPQSILHDNAKEYLHGEFATMCQQKGIAQRMSAPHHPNQNPTEHYMGLLIDKTRSLLFISGLDPVLHWENALSHSVCLQNRTALPGRCTPFEIRTGSTPDISHVRIFGCEALAYIEKEKRHKLDYKTEKCIYMGMSSRHSADTHKLLSLTTNRMIYRRNVSFNERSFPARTTPITRPTPTQTDTGEDLIGQTFTEDNETFIITQCSRYDGVDCVDYISTRTKEETYSTIPEVRKWIKQTKILQMANNIQPSRKGYMNTLAETMSKQINPKPYNTKLSSPTVRPPKSFKDAQGREIQWFEAFRKEKDGLLKFNTWKRLDQSKITPTMRQHALRAHFIYNVKRDANAKVRVVVNGKRQHESTFTDTTSPVASQLQLRTFLAITALRLYYMIQMDLTNAYLHADIVDDVYIVIPPGFPGAGEIGRLDKATYGTRQGARRFYDHTVNVLTHIGFTQCKNEPCLFRYLHDTEAAFLLLYVDDALISGPKHIVQAIEKKLMIYFDSKFNLPKDFLGLDVTHDIEKGSIKLSMSTFTQKLKDTFKIPDSPTILTPGRTDRKIIRGQDVEPDETYRSKVGSLMWATMGIRYDIIYAVKELSRVLQEPTKIAHEILDRTLTYITQTYHAHLIFEHKAMVSYALPPTRKKPNQQVDIYNVDEYNATDTVPHHDDEETRQDYTFKGQQCIVICYTDIDLAGQHETRQSTSGYLLFINGVLIHFHGRTERQIITSTCAGEYIALSRGHAACRFITTILKFYGNKENIYHLFTDNQAAEHLATQPNLNEHGRTIDTRHHEVRQDYLEGKVQIGGVKTNANPSDILTKFLPAPAHQEHSKFLNLNSPKPYTQNSNFIQTNEQPKLTSAKRYGQRRIHKLSQVAIRLTNHKGQAKHDILSESLSPVHYIPKRKRQKHRQNLWNAIHNLQKQHPHLEITLKRTLTKSRSPPHRQDAQYIQAPCCPPHPWRIQGKTPTQPTQINSKNSSILHANRQRAELQARSTQNPFHKKSIRRHRITNHDLHTKKQINKRQKKRQAHQKSTKIFFDTNTTTPPPKITPNPLIKII
jgi:hypothetical protein